LEQSGIAVSALGITVYRALRYGLAGYDGLDMCGLCAHC